MEIKYSLYKLYPKRRLNHLGDKKVRAGILFRFNQSCFVDYHPWEQFGDPAIEIVLEWLRKGVCNEFTDRLFELANLDEKRIVIKHIPFFNHILVSDMNDQDDVAPNKIVKLKGLCELEQDLKMIKNFTQKKIRLRLDFNNLSDFSYITSLWHSLSEQEQSLIDYIEDPFKYEANLWHCLKAQGIPLACDRNEEQDNYINIWKPNIEKRPRGDNYILSSYMGHDLGRYHCFLELMCSHENILKLVHGINTPSLYEGQLNLFVETDGALSINTVVVDGMYNELKEREWNSI